MLELPSDNVRPLINHEWQVSVGVNPFTEGWIHNSFRSWSNSNGLLHFRLSRLGDPCYFRRETFKMFFLLFKSSLRHKHWEVAILNVKLFNSAIKMSLDLLPNIVGSWSQNVASGDIIIVNHLRLLNDLLIPLGKVNLLTILNSQLVSIKLGRFLLLFHLGLLLLCKFNTLFLLWLIRFSSFLNLFFLAWCSSSNGGEVHYFKSCIISASELLDFVNTFFVNDSTSCVIHWVETCPLGFIENFVVNNLDFIFLIIQDREVIDYTLSASKILLKALQIGTTQISRTDWKIFVEAFHIYFGVYTCANEPHVLLFLLIKQE